MQFVEIELGGATRRLALDANAMIALEELTGEDVSAEIAVLQKQGSVARKLKTVRNLVWAASASACPEFLLDPGKTLSEVGSWFGMGDFPRIAEALGAMMKDITPPKEFPEQMAPFVPSPTPVVERMVELAELEPGKLLVDLGAGDGRLMFRATEEGGSAIGYELHGERHDALKLRIANHKWGSAMTLRREDIRQARSLDLADAVTLYLLPVSNAELKAKLLAECKPGCKIISHDFDMPDWTPDRVEQVQCEDRMHTVYRWIVPERAADAGSNG